MIRRRERLNDGWAFHRGEIDPPPARGGTKGGGCSGITDLTYAEMPEAAVAKERASVAEMKEILPGIDLVSAEEPRAQDLPGTWVPVRLPHDWQIEVPPEPAGPIWRAFRPGGVGYYRRRFTIDEIDPNACITLEFDGVMRDATVWCNGFIVGTHLNGYASFRIDVTEILRPGDNVLLVRCDTTSGEGWWYEGAGIYRDVWMLTTSTVHVGHDGVFVTTPEVSSERAVVNVSTSIRNDTAQETTVEVISTVIDPQGSPVATATGELVIASDDSNTINTGLTVETPQLWNIGDGRIYTLVTEVRFGGDVIDRTDTTFGIRTIEFRGPAGLFLNGEPVWVRGSDLHQDFAGVGVAVPDRVIEHKLSLVQSMGCNAMRSAHHPSSPALLDAADRLGILVIAENRMLSTAAPYLDDLTSLVVRGRNHPCVMLWSLENEESLQGTDHGVRLLERLRRTVRRIDPTRGVSVGGVNNYEHEYHDRLDVVSSHYMSLRRKIDETRALRADKPHMATEDGLYPTVRGQYTDDVERGLPSAFGTAMGLFGYMSETARGKSYDNGQTWQWFADHCDVGVFVWTGIDYFGEPTPMRWPVNVSSYGAIDICGFPKDYYWLLRSFFRPEPLVHLLPHWTWPGREGDRIRTWAYTNCDEVELVLNGTSVDRRAAVNHIVRWDDGIVYEPGTLVARGYQNGEAVAELLNATAAGAAALRCTVDELVIAPGGHDVALVSVEVVDDSDRLCPWADDDILFEIDGPGTVVGVGNGDPTSLEPHNAPRRRAFRGRCLAIVRGLGEGTVTVRATADALRSGSASFLVKES